ncbi:di-heme-cytochrome C peroxidase [Teredinibacter purpureus]|uniref:di-heme-cytochrome C peroxidase n=1 Tax=Teredinibacter purpureus TaxID=2731756 RepID=UPI000695DFAA|nr:di-heme-cytochrome C peroxidase [Teredinibacter purpureus]
MSITNPNSKNVLQRFLSSIWSKLFLTLLIILCIYTAFTIKNTIDELEYVLTPPTLVEYEDLPVEYINQTGWGKNDSEWFYHASQGTATIPIPSQWFTALEAPKSSPWFLPFGQEKMFLEEYVYQLGFIKSPNNVLPIGMATTPSMYFEGVDREETAVGFTCAACHTGQLTKNGTRYVIDGGPATTDLGLFTSSLGAALGQTILSSKLNIMNGRFERFSQNVLGSNNNVVTRNQLKKDLAATLKNIATQQDVIHVTEGFTRLDALNRIGNQVFANDEPYHGNYQPIDAPVNYPHIWTTSWFNWVQYDASIMQPLIRNTGEALGVAAFVETQKSDIPAQDLVQFSSSIPVANLYDIERWIAGTYPDFDSSNPRINGLQAPQWPGAFTKIDAEKAQNGADLYLELCQTCHLPTMDKPEFWRDHWATIEYTQHNEQKETVEKYIDVKIIPLQVIDTDPAQANVLTHRTVNTKNLDLNVDVCTWSPKEIQADVNPQPRNPSELTYVDFRDSSNTSFALALGAFVQHTNNQWFAQNYINEQQQPLYEGLRPNCLQAGKGYKARPLNGIWATAPYLHNGSVATVYDLLSDERPIFIELGDLEFDDRHIGITQSEHVKQLNKNANHLPVKHMEDYDQGRFVLDTREPGNFNTGHLFSERDGNRKTIGRKLSEEEKLALIEYLKTL